MVCIWKRSVSSRCSFAAWLAGVVVVAIGLGCGTVWADWPTYAHDIARSNITAEAVRPPLVETWCFQPLFKPVSAWGNPKPLPTEGILELRRVHFDDAFHVAVADGAVLFGSSSDNKVYCLDLASGRVRWTFITGGPIRLAPTVADKQVYFGSDDGYAYCLRADDGAVVWRFAAAPTNRRLLGHGKLISLWPLRTGVLVDSGVAYFGAGIFPAEGVFMFALDAKTGKELWRNDSCGETPQSRVSPQGYLLASKSTLYAPMGRVSPAAFDRETGKLIATTAFGKQVGGTYALLAGDHVYTGTEELIAYGQNNPADRFAAFDGRRLIVAESTVYLADGARLTALDRQAYPAASKAVQKARAKITGLKDSSTGMRRDRTTLERSIATLKGDLESATKAAEKQQIQAELAAAQEKLAALMQRLTGQAKLVEEAEQQLKLDLAARDKTILWSTPSTCDHAMVLAGNVLYAGGRDEVMALDAAKGKVIWSAAVEGNAKGMAASDGRLLVSTDTGRVYCFAPQGAPQQGLIRPTVADKGDSASPARRMAQAIIEQSGVRRGFCLVLGCETGDLAVELARQSELQIYAVAADETRFTAARKRVDAAGLYGGRICVEQWPLDKLPYADYFANLIVSETSLTTGQLPDAQEVYRMLKPAGGVAMLGRPESDAPTLRRWLEQGQIQGGRVMEDGNWVRIDRGLLPGAGNWTHLYATAGNTASSDDQLVKMPLGLLWFGDPGPEKMLSRHVRAAGPLCVDGRLFCQGENVVMAFDAYNGVKLWERSIQGAMRSGVSEVGSNLSANRRWLFVALADSCLQLEPATGETVTEYPLPKSKDGGARWGFIACDDESLYGSQMLLGVKKTASGRSEAVFAFTIGQTTPRWVFEGANIAHNTVAFDAGRMFLVDMTVSAAEKKRVVDELQQQVAQLPEAEQKKARQALRKPDIRRVVALDMRTGQPLWQDVLDLTQSGPNVAAMVNEGVLVLFGVYTDGHYWKQFFAGEFESRRVTAIAAEDGKMLWSKPVGYRVRPIIIGNTLHAEPWAFDLRTGEARTRVNPITGQTEKWQFARPGHHCGMPIGSPHGLFFRSYTLGYYDLDGDYGTMHFGAQRPGCWINAIPAAGLLLMPEASAGCMCPFPNMCTVVFQPGNQQKGFAYYSATGPSTPVQRLALNFGAPGDRRDEQGQLWLGFPRPSGSLVMPLKIVVSFAPGGAFGTHHSTYYPAEPTWMMASAARGISRCVIPLMEPADGSARYDVRLAFSDPDNEEPGRRVFDVRMQGKIVIKDLDIVREAGARYRPLWKEIKGVDVNKELVVEFVSKTKKPAPEEAPILQGIEVVRREVTSLGCLVPDFSMSSVEPQQEATITLGSLLDKPFSGTLTIKAPQGVEVTPRETRVKLAPGQRETLPIRVSVSPQTPAGSYELDVRLLRADRSVEVQRTARVEHLGRRGRAVFTAVADAYVRHRYGELNKGNTVELLVDGGERKMGDLDHSLALLKFQIKLPGKPVAARLRLTNAGNLSSNAGRVCLVDGPWSEEDVTYNNCPKLGRELTRLGNVKEHEVVERELVGLDLQGRKELSLAIDPTSTDGVDYCARESKNPPQLIVEYELP